MGQVARAMAGGVAPEACAWRKPTEGKCPPRERLKEKEGKEDKTIKNIRVGGDRVVKWR